MSTIDKIVGVGKNYLEHAKELGDAIPEQPVLFLKPPSVLQQAQHWDDKLILSYPQTPYELHYECEVVLKLNQEGDIGWVSLGLDMTLRKLQAELKQKGHPWTIAKVFKDAAAVGPWISLTAFPDYLDTAFSLSIDGKLKQQAFPREMLIKPLDLLSYINQFFPLCAGDIIFTGTPAGVGPVSPGALATLQWGKYHYFAEWQ